jgi:hypothetical protein
MAQRSVKISENKEFIDSERWKCSKSPTGAHHWMICSDQMTCKYCNGSKPVDANRFGWTRTEAK